MTRLLSRRRVLGAGGAAALVPVVSRPTAAGAATLGGQIVTLRTAIPFPATSNINWWASGLTLGNAGLVVVGSENSIEIHCRGAGRAHVIIDVQGYVPFVT